jgi:hypothetical protein
MDQKGDGHVHTLLTRTAADCIRDIGIAVDAVRPTGPQIAPDRVKHAGK